MSEKSKTLSYVFGLAGGVAALVCFANGIVTLDHLLDVAAAETDQEMIREFMIGLKNIVPLGLGIGAGLFTLVSNFKTGRSLSGYALGVFSLAAAAISADLFASDNFTQTVSYIAPGFDSIWY